MAVAVSLSRAVARPAPLAVPSLIFAEVVESFHGEVYGTVLRTLGDRDLAGEVTNGVFVKAFRNLDRYDARRPLRHWLLAIAVREAISAARARGRRRGRLAPEADAALVADATAGPEQHSIEREERERVRAAVAALPELYRVPIVLRYFNELSLEEVAAVTGRRASTIGVQLLRGRALLREALAGSAP